MGARVGKVTINYDFYGKHARGRWPNREPIAVELSVAEWGNHIVALRKKRHSRGQSVPEAWRRGQHRAKEEV